MALVAMLLLAGGAQALVAGSSTDGSLQFLVIGVSAMLMMVVIGGIAWILRTG